MTARPFFSKKKSPAQHFFMPEKCQHATRGLNIGGFQKMKKLAIKCNSFKALKKIWL
jgi:hypothetical protein